uniref:Uncharacterized protein n=1 Tax=Chenopodium quinoa TaxID=63459 RepID=A0A803MEW2_CHEQI
MQNLLVVVWIETNEEGMKFWNVGQVLSEIEYQDISNIRLAQSEQDDFLQWHGTKNGEFSVRSAYHFEMQRSKSFVGSSHGDVNAQIWKKIWEAKVPPKVKSVL